MRYCLMILPVILTACGPATLQSHNLIGQEGGKPRYALSGYTKPHEDTPNDSLKYVHHSMSDACPEGVNVLSLDEQPTHNVVGAFLQWEAIVQCK